MAPERDDADAPAAGHSAAISEARPAEARPPTRPPDVDERGGAELDDDGEAHTAPA